MQIKLPVPHRVKNNKVRVAYCRQVQGVCGRPVQLPKSARLLQTASVAPPGDLIRIGQQDGHGFGKARHGQTPFVKRAEAGPLPILAIDE